MFTQKNSCLIILVLLALFGCGGGGENPAPVENNSSNNTFSYTGDFLSWTNSTDSAHYLTLVRVNGKTGEVTTIGGYGLFVGLAYGPDGKLYGVSSELHIINPTNGTTTKVGDLTYLGSKILMNEATFSPDGTLYVSENSGDRIFTVDLTSGALTLVGTTSGITATGLDFSSDGTLYTAFGYLYILNAADMSTISTVGYTGVLNSHLAFGNGGVLYGKNIYPSTHIYSLDLNTGQSTVVVPVNSIGLNSFVSERTITASTTTYIQSVNTNEAISYQDINELLSMESELMQNYFKSK